METIIKDSKENLSDDVTISCNKRDMKIVEEIAAKQKMKAQFEESDISGGAILTDSEGRKVDESLQLVLERKRDEIRQEIVKIIGEH